MSKIVIKVDGTTPLPQVVAAVRKATGMSFADIRERVLGRRPVVEYALYGNNHDETARRLRSLTSEFAALGVRLRIYQLRNSQSLEDVADEATYEVTTEFLTTLLDNYDRDTERQDAVHPNE